MSTLRDCASATSIEGKQQVTDVTSPTTGRQSPCLHIDGQYFKELSKAALGWLQYHQAVINSLNVYPVPDGDTGTNMVLTMQSAWAEVEESPERNLGQIAHRVAHGALMGARGNSGVILSQIWRGFARSLDEKAVCRAEDLAVACQEAAATAYKGVVKPVEGTILTVARAVADTAARMARETDDIGEMLEHMVFAAHEAVMLTPSLLPVLREAGVVDAGGQGLFVILEGMLRYTRGEPVLEDERLMEAVDLVDTQMDFGEPAYGYDVQFLIVGRELNVDTVRERIVGLGDCPLVVGDASTIKIHIHVPDPGVPISYGASLGSLRDVVVEDMQAQYQDFIAEQELPPTTAPPAPEGIGVVSVALGDGLTRVFESLGVSAVVQGGQTMNPSTKDLLDAIETVPCDAVVLLPNNKNVILAAEQASSLSSKSVAVIPTRSIPQGVAALLALSQQADLEDNVSLMTAALSEVESGEITTATRSVTVNDVEVTAGQIIGLHDGELKVSGTTIDGVAQTLLKEMDPTDREIITLYYGDNVSESDASTLADLLQQDWPDLEIEVINGGQSHYHYILSLE
jgi:DAK2 domain fusion protein YloV